MAYRIRLGNGAVLDGQASSTVAVLLHLSLKQALTRSFPGWDYATKSGTTFTFFQDGDASGRGTRTITTDTMDGAITGSDVIVDDGSGKWRHGVVTGDGTNVSVSGQTIAATAQASLLLSENNEAGFSVTGAISHAGTAVSAYEWFSVPGGMLVGAAMSTLGAFSVGDLILVLNGTTWQLVTV